MTTAGAAAIVGVGALCWLVVAMLRPVMLQAVQLYPGALPPNPHFVSEHGLQLYVLLPIGVSAYFAALMLPGVYGVLAWGRARGATDLAVRALAVSFAVRWMIGVFWVGVLGQRWTTASFFATESVIGFGAALVLAWRARRGTVIAFPMASREWRRLAWMIALPLAGVIALSPWILWQDFNGDGLEILVTGRSLAEFAMPRFPHPSGFQGLGLGIIATAFPVHWFVMLIGPYEAAARLPFLLYLPVLLAVLIELIEFRSARWLRGGQEAALALAVVSFGTALALNGSYETYTADVAMPAASDTLAVLCIAATMLFLWRGETVWLLAFVVLGYFTRPTELMVLLLLGAAAVVLPAPARRAWLVRVALALVVCVVARFAYESVFVPWVTGGLAPGHASESLLRRAQYLTFTDWSRLLFLVVPSGIVTLAALLAVRRQDTWSRVVVLFCAVYYAFFHLQAFVNLHHFAPVMILPVVVWWRMALGPRGIRFAAPLAAAGAAVALVLGIPPNTSLYRDARELGRRISWQVGDHGGRYAAYRQALAAAPIRQALFPGYEPGGAPMPGTVLFYASRYAPSPSAADYVAQPAESAPPSGFLHVATVDGFSGFVRDSSIWMRDRRNSPAARPASRVYYLAPETLHRHLGLPRRNFDLDLGAQRFIWRFFQ